MNIWQRAGWMLRRAARAIFHDLFGEGEFDETEAFAPGSRAAGSIQLGLIQAQLDALAPQLARLETCRRQAEAGRDRLAADLAALDAQIDRDLLRGDDEQARRGAARRLELAGQVEERSRRCREQASIAADARGVLERMHKKYAEAQLRLADLSAREQDAALLENLAAARRELERALAGLEAADPNQGRGER